MKFRGGDEWSVSICESGNEGWIRVNGSCGRGGDGEVRIRIGLNEREEERKGVIGLRCERREREIRVSERGVEIEGEGVIEFYK